MKRIIFLLISIIFLNSCVNEFIDELDKIGEAKWNPQLAAPVLGGEFTIADYIDATSEEISVTQDADGVVVIEYMGPEVVSDKAEDLIQVANQVFDKSIGFDLPEINGFPVDLTINKVLSFDESVASEDGENDILDSLYLKSGNLLVRVTTLLPVSGEFEITINSILKEGLPIVISHNWSHSPVNPGLTFIENVDLANSFGDFTKSGTTSNNFNFDLDITINYEGQAISASDFVYVHIEMEDPMFSLIYGKFTEREFETEKETVSLGLFDNVNIEGFYLDNPKVEFNFKSSFGVPVEASIASLDAINSQGQALAFTGSAITTPTQVIGPSLDAVGSFERTSLIIDKNNSNITDVIAFLPAELDYQFSGKVISPSPTEEQFVLDTSRVIGEYKVTLPLDGSVANFESEQEFNDLDLPSLEQVGETKITLHSNNGLPIKVGVEIIFYDDFDNELITLFSDTDLLKPGIIDTNGFVIEEAEQTIEHTLNVDEIALIEMATKAVLKTALNTGETGSEVVKIRMDDRIQVSMFIQTSINF